MRTLTVLAMLAAGFGLAAEDVSARRMAWAHYVGWTMPDQISLQPMEFYSFPAYERGAKPYADEIRRAIAAGLDLNEISETGEIEAERLHISGNVALWPEDIRAVQLAKASVLGGMQTLMEEAGILPEQIGKFFLAGGFGSRLNLRSAARIGLLPAELISRTVSSSFRIARSLSSATSPVK